jgi:hypothetical protein
VNVIGISARVNLFGAALNIFKLASHDFHTAPFLHDPTTLVEVLPDN